MCSNAYPFLDLNVVFQATLRMGDLFRFKDVVPKCLQSKVIYSYKCQGCNSLYIGKTKRHFQIRMCEHQGVSFRNGKRLNVPSASAICDHCFECLHPFDINNFKIIDKAESEYVLNVKESIYIWDWKPDLNTAMDCQALVLF